MIPNSRSLLIKIHDLLDGKMGVEHAESAANDYNQICGQINARIRQFSKLIKDGNYYAALDVAQLEPTLTTQIERIRFPRESEWRKFLSEKGITCFEGFDDSELKRVKEICADRSTGQPTAYRNYRKAILQKDKQTAINHLRKLYSDYPQDLNAKHELVRLEKELFESVEKELKTSLRLNRDESIIQKVKETLDQDWEIEFKSDFWDQSLKIYEAHQHLKYHDGIVQAISQAKVIQRVGDWKDATDIVEKLRIGKDSSVYPELTALQQNELNTILKWYHQHQLDTDTDLRNQEAFLQFHEQLQPKLIEKNLQQKGKKEIRHFQKELEEEWKRFESLTPKLCESAKADYRTALKTTETILQERSKTGKKWIWIWAPAVPLVLVVAGGLFWINHREAQIADDITIAYEANDVASTRASLEDWDQFTNRFNSNRNPFRHYRAHRLVSETRNWIQEIDIRHQKIKDLLEKIEGSISGDPSRSELRRVQMNLSIVSDLFDNMPEGLDETLRSRHQTLETQLAQLSEVQIQSFRNELNGELERIAQLFETYFPANKTDFSNVHREISEIRVAINETEAMFRQSFGENNVTDLKDRLEDDESRLVNTEAAVEDLFQYEDRLRQSIALSEYLEYLHQLSQLPFTAHPTVAQAIKLDRNRSEFENLAQQLLLPGNAVGWTQFLEKIETPMIAQGTNPKEQAAWKKLAGFPALKEVYRYRLRKYEGGEPIGSFRMIYSHGEIEVSSENSQTSGRTVSTVLEFDERYIGRGLPFTEKIYKCETDSRGNPMDGEILEFDRLSPESGFYRQIVDLCGYNAESKTIDEPLLEVIDQIKTNEFISPIFKAWVTQELINFMIVRAYDWGLNFCPSAQLEYKNLTTIKGTLFPYDWLRPSTQNRILQPLNSYYQSLKDISYYKQAQASRELFKQIARQRVRYGGYVNENGLFMLLKATPDNRKLFGMRADGTINVLRKPGTEEEAPTNFEAKPFSPIMFFNDPPEVILDRVTRTTEVDVNSEAFRPYLPQIFL